MRIEQPEEDVGGHIRQEDTVTYEWNDRIVQPTKLPGIDTVTSSRVKGMRGV